MKNQKRRVRRRPAGRSGPRIEGYEDLRLVGRGGFAQVYRAWQSSFNREVAVKVLSRQAVDSRAFRLFDRERSALGSLSSHPNIVTVYDSGETPDGAPYLAMEYVPGGSLADRLAEGPGDWRDALRIGIKLAGALETAHRAGVLHRDIKPENVLLSEFGEPQLADFGIARLQAATQQTRSLEVNLSVPFAPPELLDGDEPSLRSDVYSLACTLHSLVLGRPSFLSERARENSMVALVVRIQTGPPADLRRHGVPDEVCRVLERGLAKDPQLRHATALDLGKELQAAESVIGLPPTVLPVPGAAVRPSVRPSTAVPAAWHPSPPPAAHPQATRPRRRPLRTVALLGGLAVLLVAGVLVGIKLAADSPGGNDATRTSTSTTAPPVPLPATTRPLPAGFYVLPNFEPTTKFSLDEGWRRLLPDRSFLVDFRPIDDNESLITVFTVVNVVDPARTYESLSAVRSSAAGIAPPEDVVAWLDSHSNLDVTSTRFTTASGVDGQRLDVYLRGSNANCPTECTALFHFGRTVFFLLQRNRNRLYVFEIEGRTVVLAVEAPTRRFDDVAARAEQIATTLELGSPTD